MYTDTNPKPQVDPYWTADDPRVIEVDVPVPNSLTHNTGDFIQSITDVAHMVKAVRGEAGWGEIADIAKACGEGTPVEYQAWAARTFTDRTPRQAAEYVIGDKPADLHRDIGVHLAGVGAKRRVFKGTAKDGVADFYRGELAADALGAQMSMRVSPTAFHIKYKYKVPRPHRVVADALDGAVEVDERQYRNLDMLTRGDGKSSLQGFTLHPNVTPNHWSYIAMHASNAGMARMIAAACWKIKPGDDMDKQVLAEAGQNAFSRMSLGVHNMPDNISGLSLGQQFALQAIPAFLEEHADADPDKVRRVLEDFWIEF